MNKKEENERLIFGLSSEGKSSAASEKTLIEIIEIRGEKGHLLIDTFENSRQQGHIFTGTFHGTAEHEHLEHIDPTTGDKENEEK
ncbi:hypothetical protein ACT7DD_15065 [Bacillus paranthracis]|uniref:Uncharacterized protein n=1 Tax=Bacillus cereus TaxID=1396 RepID=A0A1Q4L4G1_BACCE|nr:MULTISPECIES: hypothetical protein [Bacillus cereus group]EJP83464.1 hypothetical protein IAU_05444 [Bacillus cereus IS075]EOO82467.1 hypothetical protein IGS_05824 [Bacillus cereus IS845/00]EOO92530.1 hypothetical protein IGQ_05737 [Bacillus cereus IS195]MDX5927887.1 hypothetical protein [Bacillus cereus group sp. BfR-BA-00967]OKA30172.1 hypothetical protein BJR06_29635 [Bacillus cereus]